MNPESAIQRDILLALGALPHVRVFRNSVGLARDPRSGAKVRFGLCVGSSDLIGLCRGRFLALEVKTATGRPTPEQLAFIAMVRAQGGIAGVVRSVADALLLVAPPQGSTCP